MGSVGVPVACPVCSVSEVWMEGFLESTPGERGERELTVTFRCSNVHLFWYAFLQMGRVCYKVQGQEDPSYSPI